ncbi:nucleotidyl transferase AbiEii/AbiGii toxin family protein [bacterium]|nr:nucleotidyl transferase AbiEii/AbiGii toxin family protein [bacterium]MBO4711177.1 nucleotidyl transferase AbiEii/AbiGii toxin family protein [bacterium]
MAGGIDIFREHFRNYKDQYVLIGGMACDLLLDEAGIPFRATKDIDMVLIVEALTKDFAESFWQFINEGGYEARHKSSGKPEFYRFVNPKKAEYPVMIELFARPGSSLEISYSGHLAPLHLDDEISSLSAILLDPAYYEFLLGGRTVSSDVSVLDAAHLVPLKMKAWLDLTEKKSQGLLVKERDLRKHRQDVFRLFPLISNDAEISVPEEVSSDIQKFIEELRSMPFETKQIGMDIDKNEILDVYGRIFKYKASLDK